MYPRSVAMIDPNIGANEREWREDSVTSSAEVETHSSSVDGSIANESGTPHISIGLELASSDENMSSESRSPTWQKH